MHIALTLYCTQNKIKIKRKIPLNQFDQPEPRRDEKLREKYVLK